MKEYNLNIAGYNIRFETSDDGPDLLPAQRFLSSIVPDLLTHYEAGITIKVHPGPLDIPEGSQRVFHAPFVEEIGETRIQRMAEFWSVWKHGTDHYIKTTSPHTSSEKNCILKFGPGSAVWDLWIDCQKKQTDPFEYPLDGLILYYLSVKYGDIMIHASGINNSGKGYLFSGVSGKGKSTIAGLWNSYGARVIHDDRLIIRKTTDGYRMHNTPVYDNDVPRQSPLDKIFIIEHGPVNRVTPIKGASAVSLVMANCIQHNWGPEIVSGLLNSVSDMCMKVQVFRMAFKPDSSVIDKILENE